MKLVVEEIIKNEDGTSSIKFDYDDEFLEVVKKELQNDSPSEQEINQFIMQIILTKMQGEQEQEG